MKLNEEVESQDEKSSFPYTYPCLYITCITFQPVSDVHLTVKRMYVETQKLI